ncbi:hypothetical protein PENTCL1PPCAC_3303, partial [Pristionchus entomophagus]
AGEESTRFRLFASACKRLWVGAMWRVRPRWILTIRYCHLRKGRKKRRNRKTMHRYTDLEQQWSACGGPPLKFHRVHSVNIMRSEDGGRVERRGSGWDPHSDCYSTWGGIVFSHRPISMDKRVCIRVAEVPTGEQPGLLLIGVTSVDPNSIHSRLLDQTWSDQLLDAIDGYSVT